MRIRIVVADECEARFYDATDFSAQLHPAGTMSDGRRHLRDRDFSADGPGRSFDQAPLQGRRRGVASRDAADGECSPGRQASSRFAHDIASRLEDALKHDRYDRLVVMAGRPFLGALRGELSNRVRDAVIAEVPKDLVHQPDGAVRVYVPRTAFEGGSAALKVRTGEPAPLSTVS